MEKFSQIFQEGYFNILNPKEKLLRIIIHLPDFAPFKTKSFFIDVEIDSKYDPRYKCEDKDIFSTLELIQYYLETCWFCSDKLFMLNAIKWCKENKKQLEIIYCTNKIIFLQRKLAEFYKEKEKLENELYWIEQE